MGSISLMEADRRSFAWLKTYRILPIGFQGVNIKQPLAMLREWLVNGCVTLFQSLL